MSLPVQIVFLEIDPLFFCILKGLRLEQIHKLADLPAKNSFCNSKSLNPSIELNQIIDWLFSSRYKDKFIMGYFQ